MLFELAFKISASKVGLGYRMGIRKKDDENWESTDLRGRTKEGLHNKTDSHSCKNTFRSGSYDEYLQKPASRDVRQGGNLGKFVQKSIGGVSDQLTEVFLSQLARNNQQIKELNESNRDIENALARMQELKKSLSDESEH